MELYGIFAGVAMGSTAVNGAAMVDDTTLYILQLSQHQLAVGCLGEGSAVAGEKHQICDGSAVIAGEANDANGRDHISGGNGSDGT